MDKTAGKHGRRGRILVVDDDPEVADVLSRILRAQHEVVAVAGGREALERISAEAPFDAILCDLSMPEMNGPALYARLRSVAPETAAKMVFVTGGASSGARAFLGQVENPVLEKPFDVQVLLQLVRRMVG